VATAVSFLLQHMSVALPMLQLLLMLLLWHADIVAVDVAIGEIVTAV
jgi:hypothetical protein